MHSSITDINFITRLGLSALSLLTLWLGPTLTTLADGTPAPGDHTASVCIPPPERDCLKGGRCSREKYENASAILPWLACEGPLSTVEDLPVPYPVRFFFGHDPNYFGGKWHGGVDMPCPVGTPIRATMAGIVSFAGESQAGYGNLVVVQNGAYQTYYAHASELAVSPWDVVEASQVVALSGNTGFSTGPHLHYEVRVNGRQVNPLTVDWPRCGPAIQSNRRCTQTNKEETHGHSILTPLAATCEASFTNAGGCPR